jgi:integrase
VDLENAILHVRRVKQGTPATHPLTGRELRTLRRLQREQAPKSPFVFVSERATPFSKRGFQAMVERAARAAGFDMKIHPHMLRHSCGYKLANDGVDTRTIQSTSRSSIPSDTLSWRRPALKAYFGISMPLNDSQKPARSICSASQWLVRPSVRLTAGHF